MQIGAGAIKQLNIRIDNPAQLGADFVAAAVGAFEKYPLPVIIVDFGTATKNFHRRPQPQLYRRFNHAGGAGIA